MPSGPGCGAGNPEKETTPWRHQHRDTIPIATGEKAKARDIIAAIRTLEAHRAGAAPGHAGRAAGTRPASAASAPSPCRSSPTRSRARYKDAAWQALGEELKSLLTPEEYDSAKRTTFNAFYTSPVVIAAMHDALARLGVPADATVLEPGCGTGNFMAAAPAGMRFIGVELDCISGRIARALHPGADIRIENFRDTKLPEDRVDAVIGNPPFADVKLDYRGRKLPLHDFFIAKSLDALKPGGILALVTSHFTLDKQNAAAREYLAERADFLGAIRLPGDAFKQRGHPRRHRHRVPEETSRRRAGRPRRPGLAGDVAAVHRRCRHPDQPLLPRPSRAGAGHVQPQDRLYDADLQRRIDRRSGEQLAAAIRRLPRPQASPPPRRRAAGRGGRARILHPAAARTARHRGQLLHRRRPAPSARWRTAGPSR